MNARHKKNARKLADHLATGKTRMRFNMSVLCRDVNGVLDLKDHACGTVGCAVGHGPAAGLRVPPKCNDWEDYCNRKFGLHWGGDEWRWCFSGSWCNTDNTPQGAAARIYWLLDNGLPSDWRAQIIGTTPLCYTVPA